MSDIVYTAVLQALCVCWFILDICLQVAGEDEFCVKTCNCSNIGDGTPPVWPEAVAGTAGAAAPVLVGGVAYGLKQLMSRSSGKLDISNPRQGLIRDFDRKGSFESSGSSSGGYDNYKRRQSTLTMFDNEDEDFPSDDDLPRKPSMTGEDDPSWSSTPRGAPMSRPAFMPPSQASTPTAAGTATLNSWM